MGKMLNALLLVIVVELAMTIFITCTGTSCPSNTSMLTFLLNPESWSLATFVQAAYSSIFLVAGATAIIVGSIFFKNEFLVFTGFAGVFFSFGQSFYYLWQNIRSQTGFFGDAASLIASILLLGVFIYFIIACLDYSRGRD